MGDGDAHPRAGGAWRASWIWAPDDPPRRGERQVVLLRRSLDLVAPPLSAPTRVFASSAYRLRCNGIEAARGPVRVNPRRARCDTVDLGPLLRAGHNVLDVLAVHHGRATPWWMPPPALMTDLGEGELVLEADLGDGRRLLSDDTWEARRVEGWSASPSLGTVSGRGRELIDLGEASGLAELLETDHGWSPVAVRSAQALGESGRMYPPSYPYGALPPSPLPIRPVRDRSLATGPDGRLDAAEVVVGTLALVAEGPPGSTLEIDVAERVDDRGELIADDEPQGLRVTVAPAGRTEVETVDAYGFRGLAARSDDGARLGSLIVRDRSYPVTGEAAFRCSDPALERIWRVGRHTVSLCSADAYLDCPTREQRAWTGDSVVHQMVDLTTNEDWRLARWHPRLAASPRADGMLPMAAAGDAEHAELTVIPDWALHWVRSVHNLYRYAGDPDEIGALLAVVEGVVRWFEPYLDPTTGLATDIDGWTIVDWSSVPVDGASAALNGLWARALLDLAEMAEWLGDAGRARWARRRHGELVDAFEALWDPAARRYADVLSDGERGPTASQHAQAVAVVGGLAPAGRHERLVELLTDDDHLVHAAWSMPDGPAGPGSEAPVGGAYLLTGHPEPWWDTAGLLVRAQPFFRYVVHDAVVAAGRADLVPRLCRDWDVLLERCATSWSETWYGGTTSHGWSSTPTRDLMTATLGVTPAEPGFTTARVAPTLGPLDWAEGSVPTPHGPIRVRAERGAEGTVGVDVDSPVPVVGSGRGSS